MNYDEDKLRKTWYIVFLPRGSLSHLIYFEGRKVEKHWFNVLSHIYISVMIVNR